MVMAVATWGVFELWNPLDSASQSRSSAASETNTDSTADTQGNRPSFILLMFLEIKSLLT